MWQLDDIVVDGADTVTLIEGSFTGTLTGMSSATTGTVSYKIFANSAGTGKSCVVYIAANITGTSNTTAMTMTGLPAAIRPTTAVFVPCLVFDNGATQPDGCADISASGSTITFYTDDPLSAGGFTGSGTKGLERGWSIEYAL